MSSLDNTRDFGAITSTDLKDGPVAKRKCTDVLCCMIFTAFLVASTAIKIYVCSVGHPKMLI